MALDLASGRSSLRAATAMAMPWLHLPAGWSFDEVEAPFDPRDAPIELVEPGVDRRQIPLEPGKAVKRSGA
jgi:hypothetical protein